MNLLYKCSGGGGGGGGGPNPPPPTGLVAFINTIYSALLLSKNSLFHALRVQWWSGQMISLGLK